MRAGIIPRGVSHEQRLKLLRRHRLRAYRRAWQDYLDGKVKVKIVFKRIAKIIEVGLPKGVAVAELKKEGKL